MKKIDYFLIYNENKYLGKSIIEFALNKEQLRGLRDQILADNNGYGINPSVKVNPPIIQTCYPYYFMLIDSSTPVLIEGIHFNRKGECNEI